LWVKRDITSKYRQTLLGPLWFVVQPLFTTLVFVVVFSKSLKIPTDGISPVLFYLTGLLVWHYVSQCLNSTSMTLVAHAGLFKKIYFPRLILPFSYCLSSLVTLAIQLGVLGVFYLAIVLQGSGVRPSLYVLLLPVLLIQLIFLSFGLGLWLSSLTVRYRDFHHVWSLISPLWLYATPISYPLSAIPPEWRWLVELNPLTTLVESFRLGILGQGTLTAGQYLVSWCLTALLVVSGIRQFHLVERNCVDTL
jgi:lipopolysaccharide transport system permease protein